jgi:putative SOS response-associated peptidase YedK
MCGRFTQAYTWRELYELYRLTCPPVNTQPRYNIAPTTMIDVVVPHEAGRDLVSMRWGLIPSWWKKTAKEVPSTFNARAETGARFKSPKEQTLWHYRELANAFQKLLPGQLADELVEIVIVLENE